jgi:hypothetical protein
MAYSSTLKMYYKIENIYNQKSTARAISNRLSKHAKKINMFFQKDVWEFSLLNFGYNNGAITSLLVLLQYMEQGETEKCVLSASLYFT